MNKSESIKNIAKALSMFQHNVSKIKKDGKNPFFKSNYATLTNILDTIANPLENSGLVFSQLPDGDNSLTTILIHTESGEFIEAPSICTLLRMTRKLWVVLSLMPGVTL